MKCQSEEMFVENHSEIGFQGKNSQGQIIMIMIGYLRQYANGIEKQR